MMQRRSKEKLYLDPLLSPAPKSDKLHPNNQDRWGSTLLLPTAAPCRQYYKLSLMYF